MPFTSHFLSLEVVFHSQLSNMFTQTSVHSQFFLSMMIDAHNVKTNIIHSKVRGWGCVEEAGLKRTLKAGPLVDSDTDSFCNLYGAIWELYSMDLNTASGFVCDL